MNKEINSIDSKSPTGFKLLRWMLSMLGPLKKEMLVAISTGTLGYLLSFSISLMAVYGVFSILDGEINKKLLYLIVIAGFLRGVFHYIEQYFNHLIAFKILAKIRNVVFSAMRRLTPAKLDTKNPGDLLAIIMGDIELLEVFYAHTISPVLIAFLCLLSIFIFNFLLHPYLALTTALIQLFIAIIIPLLAYKKGRIIGVEVRQSLSELNASYIDKIKGIRESIQFSAEDSEIDEVAKLSGDLLNKQKILRSQNSHLSGIMEIALIISSGLYIYFVFELNQASVINYKQAVLSLILLISSYSPFLNLANLASILNQSFASARRVFSLVNEEAETEEIRDGKNVDYGDIEFNDVSFKYNNGSEVLSNNDFYVKKNEIVGIMGSSGRGKSTMLKLILRFWDPSEGYISLNGMDLNNINTKSLLSKMNYMTQSSFFFSASIRENLLIVNENASDEEMFNALKKACLYDFVISLKDGLDSIIEEDGLNLSGGERQRLALARCFLSDKKIFLLDEATSNLDSINEATILKSLISERKGKTIVIVSHRESTLAVCDRIYQLGDN